MALTTVTSLSETFVSGQPIVAEDAPAKDEQTDEDSAPLAKVEVEAGGVDAAIEVEA